MKTIQDVIRKSKYPVGTKIKFSKSGKAHKAKPTKGLYKVGTHIKFKGLK